MKDFDDDDDSTFLHGLESRATVPADEISDDEKLVIRGISIASMRAKLAFDEEMTEFAKRRGAFYSVGGLVLLILGIAVALRVLGIYYR